MINNFQRIVLLTAVVIFIIFMIFIGTVLYKNKYSTVFPPIISSCPDYWIDQQTGSPSSNIDTPNKQACFNTKNLGNTSCSKTMDFSENYWQGSIGECRKYKWAKECDLTWDGITNNPSICDQTTSN